jgi:hypothetical protein
MANMVAAVERHRKEREAERLDGRDKRLHDLTSPDAGLYAATAHLQPLWMEPG